MILIVCNDGNCGTVTRVMGEQDQLLSLLGPGSEYWPDKFKCPRCEGLSTAEFEANLDPAGVNARNFIELEVQEMFLVQMGMGTPEQRDCRPHIIAEMFKSKKVHKIHARVVPGTWRTILEIIEFDDGSKMYFGASTHGASVYRITAPLKHTEQALQEIDNG